MSLRPALRDHRPPSERLVGWAPAQVQQSARDRWLFGAMVSIPLFGHIFAALMHDRRRRWLVLTTRRLVVLSPGRRALGGNAGSSRSMVAIEDLGVSGGSQRRFFGMPIDRRRYQIAGPDARLRLDVIFGDKERPPAARLERALTVLAREVAKTGESPVPVPG